MNIKAKLLFRGETRELLQTDVTYNQLVQENGKPTSALLGGVITVHFQSQMYDDTFIETMFEHRFGKESNLRHSQKLYKVHDGKITFYKEEDDLITELFQYNFKDATIIDYQEEFNNQFGMYVTLTISPAMQDYRFFEGSTIWEERSPTRYKKPWKESYVPPRKGKIKHKEDKEPKIKGIQWVDIERKEPIKEATYEETTGLKINLINNVGGKAKVTIRKKDNSTFENDKKEIVYDIDISEDEVIYDVKLDKKWENIETDEDDEFIATLTYENVEKSNETNLAVNSPRVQVNFSLPPSYKGEFGFDFVDTKYKDVMGNYYIPINTSNLKINFKDPTEDPDPNMITGKLYKGLNPPDEDLWFFNKDKSSYEKWKKSFKNKIEIEWKKKLGRKDYIYHSPIVSLIPNKNKAKLYVNVAMEGNKKPKKIKIVPQKGNTGIEINKKEIEVKFGLMEGFLEISCSKPLKEDLKIDVLADKQLCGQIVILKNDIIKKINVGQVFIKTKTNSSAPSIDFKMMTRVFNQALVKVETVETLYLNVLEEFTGNRLNATEFLNIIETKFDKSKYKNVDYFLFFCDREANKKGISRKNIAICFKNHNESTIPHELLHSIGLPHTFTNKIADKDAKYTYKKESTNNIMDYSSDRNHLFYWQWKVINKLIKK